MAKKTLIITAIIIAVIAIGATAAYIVLRQGGEVRRKEVATIPEEPTAEPMDTSNWKTYRNERYRFEVKYPPTWEVSPYSVDTEAFLYPKGGLDPLSPKARGDEYWITTVRIIVLRGAKGKTGEESVKAILENEKIKQTILRKELILIPRANLSVWKILQPNELGGIKTLEFSVFIPNKSVPNTFLDFGMPYNQRSEKERQESEIIFNTIVRSIVFY